MKSVDMRLVISQVIIVISCLENIREANLKKTQAINMKGNNSFKDKGQKIKFKYVYPADNIIFVHCNAKGMRVPHHNF